MILISRPSIFGKTLHWRERILQSLIRLKTIIPKWMLVKILVGRNLIKAKALSVEELTTSETKGLEGSGAREGDTAGWMTSTDEVNEKFLDHKQACLHLGRV